MKSKKGSGEPKNAGFIHLLRGVGDSGHQEGQVTDVSIHLVPPVLLHHVSILATVTAIRKTTIN